MEVTEWVNGVEGSYGIIEMSNDANQKLRDEFAGRAMQALIISTRISTTAKCTAFVMDKIGEQSYEIADIMMAEKAKTAGPGEGGEDDTTG